MKCLLEPYEESTEATTEGKAERRGRIPGRRVRHIMTFKTWDT